MAKIISPRLGTPGDEFDEAAAEAAGVNVQALIDGGFISATGARKSAKKVEATEEN